MECEVITDNNHTDPLPITTSDSSAPRETTDFKYLGSWVNSPEQNLKVRKALAWRALNGVWYLNLPWHIKLSLLHPTVESVLLHGCESWTQTSTLQKSLDGCCTRMLLTVLNVDQNIHITNKDLYGQPTEAQQEGSSQEDEAGRPLPQTPGGPGQQAGPMGTSARASNAGTFHTNICGRPEEGCRS